MSPTRHRLHRPPALSLPGRTNTNTSRRKRKQKDHTRLRGTGGRRGRRTIYIPSPTPTPTPLLEDILRGRPPCWRLRHHHPSLVARKTQMRPTGKQWPNQIHIGRVPTKMHQRTKQLRILPRMGQLDTRQPRGGNPGNGGSGTLKRRIKGGHWKSTGSLLRVHPHHDS